MSHYIQTFEYDSIGNMLEKASFLHLTPGNNKPKELNYNFTYLYEGTQPHAPSRIANWNYLYDHNGNLIRKDRLTGNEGKEKTTNEDDDKFNQGQGKAKGHYKEEDEKAPNPNSNGYYSNKDKDDSAKLDKSVKEKPEKDNNGNNGKGNNGKGNDKGNKDDEIPGGGTSGDYYWNEENRLTEAKVNGRSTYFLYNHAGERTVKRGQNGETLYVSEHYQLQNQQQVTKHIFVGTTRIVSKLSHYHNPDGLYDSGYELRNIYYYHPDHLGSSNFITNGEGKEFEHIEYTPYGETWIDDGSNLNVIGYRFTSKELDTETGLYYFGARYLDPQVSRWISPDPAFEDYLPVPPVDDEARRYNSQLPGQGGVLNPVNINVYCYGANNPVKYVDPDGEEVLAVSVCYGTSALVTWFLANAPEISQAITETSLLLADKLPGMVEWAKKTGDALRGKKEGTQNESSSSGNQNKDPKYHGGFRKQVSQMKDKSLRKPQGSLEKKIIEHKNKIADNPLSKAVEHWKHELRVFESQMEIVKQEIVKRGLK